jgi:sugar/nucleoside kinase (ribokinase family)
VIAVVGRPGSTSTGDLDGLAAAIGRAARGAGADVELIGSVGDDREGDRVVVLLGQAGIGHAALLRDPAGRTPVDGDGSPPPRLEAADVDLGLRYLPDVRAIVLADVLDPSATRAVLDAAAYHACPLVLLLAPGADAPPDAGARTTVIALPEEPDAAFATMVGRLATFLERGDAPDAALAEASFGGPRPGPG